MKFSTDISGLWKDKNVNTSLVGIDLPTQKDVFFMAKKKELFDQYQSARILLRKTVTDDWERWFNKSDSKDEQEMSRFLFMNIMFETALMYYNIVVDLSWTLCYVSAEYALYGKDKNIDISGMMNIEDAYNAMREAEKLVTGPNSPENPFEYLKSMCPEFKDSIDLIIGFWKKFSNTNIRTLYNFIKHKGKPLYEEVKRPNEPKFMGLTIKGESYPTDIREVQKNINLKDSIEELKDFDDKVLYPYIEELFQLLELAVNPSPLIS